MFIACETSSLNYLLCPRAEVFTVLQQLVCLCTVTNAVGLDFFLLTAFPKPYTNTLLRFVCLLHWSGGFSFVYPSCWFMVWNFSASGDQLLTKLNNHVQTNFFVCFYIHIFLLLLLGYWRGRRESWWDSSGFRKYNEENSKKKQQRYRAVKNFPPYHPWVFMKWDLYNLFLLLVLFPTFVLRFLGMGDIILNLAVIFSENLMWFNKAGNVEESVDLLSELPEICIKNYQVTLKHCQCF